MTGHFLQAWLIVSAAGNGDSVSSELPLYFRRYSELVSEAGISQEGTVRCDWTNNNDPYSNGFIRKYSGN